MGDRTKSSLDVLTKHHCALCLKTTHRPFDKAKADCLFAPTIRCELIACSTFLCPIVRQEQDQGYDHQSYGHMQRERVAVPLDAATVMGYRALFSSPLQPSMTK